jgi:tRNA G10  N-methylase Trm11
MLGMKAFNMLFENIKNMGNDSIAKNRERLRIAISVSPKTSRCRCNIAKYRGGFRSPV